MWRFLQGGALTTLLLVAPVSFAEFDPSECQAVKPKIENYDSYDAFIVEIIRYKKVQRACANLPKELTTPAPQVAEDKPLNMELIELNEETGLEDMNTAIRRARNYSHIPHDKPTKYNRSTPESIPLSKVNNSELTEWDIEKGFDDPGTGEPISYDEMAEIAVDTDQNSVTFHSATSEQLRAGSYVHTNEHLTTFSQNQDGFTDAYGNSYQMRADGGRDHLMIHDVKIGN